MNNILHYNIKENGVVSSLPYLFMAVFSWCGSYSADLLRRKNYLRITIIRKICNTIGFVGPALCLFGVIMVGCNHIISSVLFALSMGFNGFISAGFIVCHMDLAPDFAGTLMGITNAFGNISGFLAPYFVGVLTQENETLYRWTLVFSSSIGFYIVTNLLFVVFGSAELQHWGVASNPENKEMDKIPSSATN
ncbi:putative inorganic phosphate cotransporter [Limulus polyphemus]|uniref:Inorganic phosphate cotransporter n=1 Tax=Limulus polyphemus TaxID=6850 RepID=A0ABM1RWM0_LIMPO|nr:putative inorganic phosphate cotransporter [Limulus polyphemus]